MILCKTNFHGEKKKRLQKRKENEEKYREERFSELQRTEPVDLKSRWQLTNAHEIGCPCVKLNCFAILQHFGG